MSDESTDGHRSFQLSNQLIFWILGILATFVLTIGGVMVTSLMSMNTNLAQLQTEMRLSRENTDRRLSVLENDVKTLMEFRAVEEGRLRARPPQ